MYCRNCGKQIDDGVSFCPECGAKVGAPAEQTQNDTPRVYCKNCGREVAANATLCPNCGAKIEPQNKKPINALGIAGFVLSLISLWGGSVFVVPIVGLILSAIGVAQREKYSSNGFATAGLVISIVTLGFWALMVALIVTGVVTGFFVAFFDAVYPSGAAAF